jgi:hypothetical protein
MKIYITNKSLYYIEERLNRLKNILIEKNVIYELYPENDSIYTIEKNKIYKINRVLNENYTIINNYKGYDLLIDESHIEKSEVISQLPMSYILTKKIEHKYKLNEISNFMLVVICIYEKNIQSLNYNIKVIDYYVENIDTNINININNIEIQEELNRLLSYLN